MTVECAECGEEHKSINQLRTHVLLNHPELARTNSDQYTAEVSKGYLNKTKVPKGEQFGYRKQ